MIEQELKNDRESISIKSIFSKNYLRKALFISCLVQFASCFSGDAVMAYFSTSLLKQVGLDDQIAGGTIIFFNQKPIYSFIYKFLRICYSRHGINVLASSYD